MTDYDALLGPMTLVTKPAWSWNANRSPSMTDGTNSRFEILSIALQLICGATEGPPGGPGSVSLAGDLPGLADEGDEDYNDRLHAADGSQQWVEMPGFPPTTRF